jgi:hypothetical protein
MMRVSGLSLDVVAEKFSLHRDAIWRHMRKHVPDDVKASYLADVPITELAERATKENVSLIDYFALVRSAVISQMLLAASANDGHRTAVLAGRAVEVLREIGRFTGELSNMAATLTINNNNSTIVNMNAPIFVSLQTMLIEKLEPWPEAMSAVITGLNELEAGGDNAIAA